MTVYLLFGIAISLLGFSLRYHWWRMPSPYKVPRVLMYHMVKDHLHHQKKRNKWRVKPEDFDKQMAWFAKHGWHAYSVSELITMQKIPPKSFCITFDDGYEDNYLHAFPILQKYGFKATIYLVPGYMYNSWEGFEDGDFDRLLSTDQIVAMQQSGLIEFGSHTLHHKNLLTLSKDEAKAEIERSKEEVEKITGADCKAFAYPYGKYDQSIVDMVKEAGYTNATIVKRGLFEVAKPFEIKRLGILGTESFFDFYLKVTRIRNKF